MWKTSAAGVLIATTVAANAAGQDARRVIDEASSAMGIVGLGSITFSGAAATGNFGQSRTISFGLASTGIRNYTRTIDFTTPASHATGAILPPVQRGAPPPSQPPTLGVYDQSITPADTAWAQQKYVVNTHPHFDHAGGLAPFCRRRRHDSRRRQREVLHRSVSQPATHAPGRRSGEVAQEAEGRGRD
jgi:hypothetical protein